MFVTLCSGVLQGWPAGRPGGDERREAVCSGHHDSGSGTRLPHEEGVCQDDGKEVL